MQELADIDSVKTLNETMGHHAGDLLLAEVARRLVSRRPGVRSGGQIRRR